MSGFTFRLKVRVCSRTSLGIDEPRIEWPPGRDPQILVLSSGSDEVSISDAEVLYLHSSGWESEADAFDAAQRHSSAFFRTLARLRIGVDAGRRGAAGGGFTSAVLTELRDTVTLT